MLSKIVSIDFFKAGRITNAAPKNLSVKLPDGRLIPKRTRTVKNKYDTNKREKKESEWIDNKAKHLKQTCQAGFGRHEKIIAPRILKNGCADNCRFKCKDKISLKSRKRIFENFWDLSTKKDKWKFIIDFAETEKYDMDPSDKKIKQKEVKHLYFLPLDDDNRVKVCKTMFLAT